MGGGSKQKAADPGNVAPANTGATNAANQASTLGTQFSGQQQQLYNMLYGLPTSGAGGGSGGALLPMLDPKSLQVTKPTGVYAQQNVNANNAAAKQYALNSQQIKTNAAQNGFGPNTPSGFTQNELDQNARALADTKGSNFSTSTTNQYQDALANFWKAAGLTATGTAQAGQGALSGTNTAADTYANLYGTATKPYTTTSNGILGPIVGAAGTAGTAAMGPGGAATTAIGNK